MSFPPQQPAESRPPTQASAGAASDFKSLVAAALMTFGAGTMLLIGYVMAGMFGGLIGLFGAGFAISWWSGVHGGKVFPRDLPAASLGGLAAAAAVLLLLAYAMA